MQRMLKTGKLMMMNNRRLAKRYEILISVVILFMAVFSISCSSAAPPRLASAAEAAVGPASKAAQLSVRSRAVKDAFDVPLLKLDGSKFKLGDYKGKVLIVDFWATFCPPCVRQMPQLAELYRKHHAKGLELVGLSGDEISDQKKVEDFISQWGANYTIGFENQWVARAFLKGTEDETRTPPIPQLFVFSRDGRLVEHQIGEDPKIGLSNIEKIVLQELSINTASR
jgi:thiol-disulfide isomerase/thioredoxin